MDQPVTTNPIIIMMINMTVVFAVLWGLSLIVRLLHLVDPTRKKEAAAEAEVLQKKNAVVTEIAPAGKDDMASEEPFILVAAALAAYGCKDARIVSIRPVKNPGWTQTARMEAVQNSQRMF